MPFDAGDVPFPEKEPNINISAFRLMCLYKLLCQVQECSFADLNTYMVNHPYIGRTVSMETLNKYLQTLRMLGCRISRYEKNGQTVLRLDDHPLKPALKPEQMKALLNIEAGQAQMPLRGIQSCLIQLAGKLYRLPKEYLLPNGQIAGSNTLPMQPGVDLELVCQFQKYCSEGQVLEIRTDEVENDLKPILLEPQRVFYYRKRLYLMGIDPKTNRVVRYELEKIRVHRQLPSRVKTQTLKTTVAFKLTGRIAKSYRPYPGETVMDKGEFLLVTNRTDEIEQLLGRLMKYGPYCELISPPSVREEMRQRIDRLLSLLADDAGSSTGQTAETRHKWDDYPDSRQTWDALADD